VNESSKVGEPGLEFRVDPKQFVAKNTAPGAQDLPPYQPKLVKDKSESSSASPPKPLTQQALEKLRKMLTRSPVGKLGFNSDSERKETPDTQESREDESANPLVWPWRGKVFLRVKGMWIDQEYKPEMQEWRCIALPRDSEQYKRVLRDEPV